MLNMRFSFRTRLSLSTQALLALIPLLLLGPVAFSTVSAENIRFDELNDGGNAGSGYKTTGQQSKLVASISFEGLGLVPQPPDFVWMSNGHLWTEVMAFMFANPAVHTSSSTPGITGLQHATHLFEQTFRMAKESGRIAADGLARNADPFAYLTQQYSQTFVDGNDPDGLIEVPVFVPGVGPPMFLMTYRNSTYEEDIQAARYFISKHPVFGLDSRPSKDEDIKRKMLYVLTMIELRKSLLHFSHGFFAWANEIFNQFEPLMLQSKTGRKVFLDLGSRRGEYFSHFHKFYFFKDFEWMLFECNNRRVSELAQLVEDFQGRGVKVDFIDEAVWIENTTLTFHVDDDEENADHGSSLFEDHAMVHEDGIQVEVPAMNFSDFLARNFRPEDTVIVRCDIEGAEYEVLKSLIVTGTARLVDYIDVEWHAMLSPSLHHLKQADTVLPWLLEGFGTRVKGSDYYYEVECSSESNGAAQVCWNTKYVKGKKGGSGGVAAAPLSEPRPGAANPAQQAKSQNRGSADDSPYPSTVDDGADFYEEDGGEL